jgi:methyltransferase (TIGR00027 family)
MRDGKPSFTAAWVAGCRALGVFLPDDARLASDPYGARFCGPAVRAVFAAAERVPALRPVAVAPVMPWVAYMQVRTRAIDDALRTFVAAGGAQLVILGAGFDCRAARFADLLATGRVFEVDHPATQSVKRAAMSAEAQAPVAYVPWNFETRSLDELPAALAAVGLDSRAPTLVIWEGVTMYLSERAIEETLAAVRRLGAPGSMLVFNYIDRDRIEHPRGLARLVSGAVARLGEPHVFGWHPDELPAWLAARGFALEVDRGEGELARLLPERMRALLRNTQTHVAIARSV